MNPVLSARKLAFGHRGRALGEGLNLDMVAGELLCLLGPNGCGKTTLFRTLLGLLPALAGDIRIAGLVPGHSSRQAMARCVAYVPQAHVGTFAYAVEDVVLMGRSARMGSFAMPSAHDRHAAHEALDKLCIAHLRQCRYTEISGGERQLVLIARALAQQTPLMVMDEPTASLDFGNQVRVLRQIRSLRAQGMAVLLSTHQPEHAMRVGDRVAMMQAGSLLALGEPAAVMTRERLAALYGVALDDIACGLWNHPTTT